MVPQFNEHGLLPTFATTGPERSRHQSPYPCTLEELRREFGNSRRRLELIDGLDRYRADLGKTGLRVAFQWIGGSFVERDSEPNDIDLVNFFYPMRGMDADLMKEFVLLHGELFHKPDAKLAYGCEPNFVAMISKPSRIVMTTAYWCTLFGVSRSTGLPKGFLVLPGFGPPRNHAAS